MINTVKYIYLNKNAINKYWITVYPRITIIINEKSISYIFIHIISVQ
jgi:hypothetical protein